MDIASFAVKRPIAALVLNLVLVVLGFFAFSRLPLREFPDINPPVVTVETVYPGAPAAIVDTKVTEVIEDSISGVEGIRIIESTSSDVISEVIVEFDLDVDIDAAANDIRDRVGRVADDLPEEVNPPEIFKVDANNDVILWLNLVSEDLDEMALTDLATRFIADQLSTINGVARIRIGGGREYSMRVWLDPEAMAAREITVQDIEGALRRENVEFPAGRIETIDRYYTLRLDRAYFTVADFEQLTLRRSPNGHLTRLGEVADLEIGPKEWRSELRSNGQSLVGLGIIAQSEANAVAVSQEVRGRLDVINRNLPEGTKVVPNYDSTVFINAAIEEIFRSLFLAAAIVVAVVFVFLGRVRATLVPAVTVPISLIAVGLVLLMVGATINLLTLLALLLGIGLVVDDAIVVLENVERRIRLGESPGLAAIRGTRQVFFAVVATTVILVAVFLPIAFLQGDTGRLFSEFALTLAGAVCFSTVAALTICPMLCAALLKGGTTSDNAISRWTNAVVDGVAGRYRAALDFTFRYPAWLIATVVLVVAIGMALPRHLPRELAPSEDRGSFFIFMRGPEGASFEYSRRYMRAIEEILLPYLDSGEARRILVRTPGFGNPNLFNSGVCIINLVPWNERERSTQQVMGEIAGKIGQLPGVLAFPVARSGLSRRTQEPVQFVLGGNTYEDLAEFSAVMLEAAQSNPNLQSVDSDYKETKPELRTAVNLTRAAELQVSANDIGRTLETVLGAREVTTYLDRGEEYDVMLQARQDQRSELTAIDTLKVRSDRGELIPLSNLLEVEPFGGASSLNRFNRTRSVTISASLAEGYALGEALSYLEREARERLGDRVRIDYKGQSREFTQSNTGLLLVFGMALVLVYLVLSAQFSSFVHPISIMLTVPLAVAGAFSALFLFGSSLNIFSQIGIIVLVGLATKNGILLVEFANQLRGRGLSVRQAALDAAHIRFRPVIMTAVSTTAGALPLVLSSGAGSESRFTIGIVIIGGVLLATALTLFLVPYVYRLTAHLTRPPEERIAELDAEDANRPHME